MAKDDPQPRIKDGFINALGGVNSDLEPDVLAANVLAWAENVTLRGGYPRNRPGYDKRTLVFPNSEVTTWWATKAFQGAATYESPTGINFQIASVGGRIFKVDILNDYAVSEITPTLSTSLTAPVASPALGASVTWAVTDATKVLINLPVIIGDGSYEVTNKVGNQLTMTNINATPGMALPAGTLVVFLDPNSSLLDTVYFSEPQVEEYMVIQDGQSKAIIFNGASCRRSNIDEVPVGTSMSYHQGRLWMAINGNQVAAGDIVMPANHAAALKFTEEQVITGGGRFQVSGTITAIVEMPALDASLGQGPLMVITKKTFNNFNLPTARETWATLTTPFQTIALKNYGALNQNGCVIVNGDVWYRAKDGYRSFIIARRDFGTWGNTPMSTEMRRVMDEDSKSLLRFTSAVLFDNRMLFTVNPHRLTIGAYWSGIVALDFDALASIAGKSDPIYEGMWTGLHPYQLVVSELDEEERCFIWTNETDGIGLWELSKEEDFDNGGNRIPSLIEMPSFKFQSPMVNKKLQSCKTWVADLIGLVDFTLRFRVDDARCWMLWGTRSRCSKVRDCDPKGCYHMATYKAGYKPHMGWGLPPDTVEEFEKKNARYGYEWQLRLEWVGRATIKRTLVTADRWDMQTLGGEDQDED